MISREDAVKACLKFPNAYEDYPFDDLNWTVMRHADNNKSFALIFERDGKINVNVKVRPCAGEMWREVYPFVVPAYHMNKTHWIGIILSADAPEADVMRLIAESYELTLSKKVPSKN